MRDSRKVVMPDETADVKLGAMLPQAFPATARDMHPGPAYLSPAKDRLKPGIQTSRTDCEKRFTVCSDPEMMALK